MSPQEWRRVRERFAAEDVVDAMSRLLEPQPEPSDFFSKSFRQMMVDSIFKSSPIMDIFKEHADAQKAKFETFAKDVKVSGGSKVQVPYGQR